MKKLELLTAVVLAAGALTASVTGCELLTTIDRGKIPGAGGTGTGGSGGSTTSTSGSGGSTTSTSGSGGACGMACTAATECPDPGTECVQRTCDMGCCGTTKVADGTPTTGGQTGEDCKKVVCDGNGATKTVDDDGDVPAAMDDCHEGVCTAGTPAQGVLAAGAACTSSSGQVCDGAGLCVECNSDAQCTAPKVCDPLNGTHKCVPADCADGALNGSETDEDCGGAVCGACANGKVCLQNRDCIEGRCDAGHCAAAACDDGIADGAPGALETDVDCGGPCVSQGKTCAVGLKCQQNADCATAYCDSATKKCATPACNDDVKNGAESDKDCGGGSFQSGPVCPKCATGKVCGSATDCQTGYCSGNLCATKPGGLPCGANEECSSYACGTSGSGNCCTASCATAGTCGATGCAAGTGACQYPATGTACGASCNNAMLTVSTCDGSGACLTSMPATCPGGLICASATACKTTCTADTDCTSPSAYCSSGACVPKHATGACTDANQCTSGICGSNGNCCSATCLTGTCGTTACDATGACTYPTSATSCAAPSCSGATFTAAATCNGSGACGTPTQTDCAATGKVCNASLGCVACNQDADCPAGNDAGSPSCANHVCQ